MICSQTFWKLFFQALYYYTTWYILLEQSFSLKYHKYDHRTKCIVLTLYVAEKNQCRLKMTVHYVLFYLHPFLKPSFCCFTGAAVVSRPITRATCDVCNEAVGDPTHRPCGTGPFSWHRPLPGTVLRLAAKCKPDQR